MNTNKFPEDLIGLGGNTGEGHPEINRRTLERTRLVVAKVDADPNLIELAVTNLKRWMARTNGKPKACHAEWMKLLAEKPWEDLRSALLEESDEGQRLRSSLPFAGVLTEQERRSVR